MLKTTLCDLDLSEKYQDSAQDRVQKPSEVGFCYAMINQKQTYSLQYNDNNKTDFYSAVMSVICIGLSSADRNHNFIANFLNLTVFLSRK